MKLVKMRRSKPTKPGGPLTADVHVDEVENWLDRGWGSDNEPRAESPIPPAPASGGNSVSTEIGLLESIEELRRFAAENGLKLHHKIVDVEKARARLLEQAARQ